MRYLIYKDGEAFYTKWYDYESHFIYGMVIFDLAKHTYTTNGKNWNSIEDDHL